MGDIKAFLLYLSHVAPLEALSLYVRSFVSKKKIMLVVTNKQQTIKNDSNSIKMFKERENLPSSAAVRSAIASIAQEPPATQQRMLI